MTATIERTAEPAPAEPTPPPRAWSLANWPSRQEQRDHFRRHGAPVAGCYTPDCPYRA